MKEIFFLRSIRQILQHNKAEDFILATGETHTIRKFVYPIMCLIYTYIEAKQNITNQLLNAKYYYIIGVELSFAELGITIEWQGKGENAPGVLWTIFQFHAERSDMLSLIEASKLLLSGAEALFPQNILDLLRLPVPLGNY